MGIPIVSDVVTAVDLFVRLLKGREEKKKGGHQALIFESVRKLRRYSDRCRGRDLRNRHFRKDWLAMQLGGNAHLIDEVLTNMEERGLARSTSGIPDLWEIGPFLG